MSTDRETTRLVRSWLEEGVTRLPDRVLDAVIDQVPATPQRRSRWPARRTPDMHPAFKLALAAAAVAAAVVIGINLLTRAPTVGNPTAPPSPTPSTGPSPVVDGPLSAGRYSTAPFGVGNGICRAGTDQPGCSESPADDTIRVAFTLPDGWAGAGGSILRALEANSPPGGAGLSFGRGAWLHTDPCRPDDAPAISTGTSVDEFVAALVAHPGLDVTVPTDSSLAGYAGKYLELTVPATIGSECSFYVVFEPGIFGQGPGHLWHLWVLDVAGTRVVIRSDTYPETPAAVQAELSAIVESIEITP